MVEGLVWLNDRLLPADEATISPFERGFLYGEGLFETLRVYQGIPGLLGRHLRRLYQSAELIKLNLPGREYLRESVCKLIAANHWNDARLRITVARGVEGRAQPTIVIHGRPLLQEELEPEPTDLVVMPYVRERSPFPVRLKSLNYLTEILGITSVRSQGALEGVFLTEDGYVAEGGMSNIFCLVNGRLLTPPLELGVLPGITRARIIEIGVEEGIDVYEERFPLQTLRDADEVFITNSVREIVPVKSVAGKRIKNEGEGELTLMFRTSYRASIHAGHK